MTVTVESFLERYPVFVGISEEVIQEEIIVATIDYQSWTQPFQDKAINLMVAHVLRLEHGDLLRLGSGLRSIEEGSEVKVDLIDLSLPYYQQTIYGQQFLNLWKQQKGFSMFVV